MSSINYVVRLSLIENLCARLASFEGLERATPPNGATLNVYFNFKIALTKKRGFVLLKLTYEYAWLRVFAVKFENFVLYSHGGSRALLLIELFILNFSIRTVVPIRRAHTDSMDSIKYLWRMRQLIMITPILIFIILYFTVRWR